jgi:UDP-2,3-diacylglucosamine hydrolase
VIASFISDLHLREAEEPLAAILLRYLQGSARKCPRLFVLGDLFETWVGDDERSALADQVAGALAACAAAGVQIGFQHGNRDFLLGADFARRAGLRLLPDPCVIELAGRAVLLSHGDRYCTDDQAYQTFRRQVRDPDWQRAFLSRPLDQRQAFARQARAESAAHQLGRSVELGDVNRGALEAELSLFGIDLLVHGHTHRPATHEHAVDGRSCQRWVLADWRAHGEALLMGADGRLHRQSLS